MGIADKSRVLIELKRRKWGNLEKSVEDFTNFA